MSDAQFDPKRMTDQPFRQQHWHVDKSVSVGHLATALLLMLSLATAVLVADRRIEDNRAEIEKNHLRIIGLETVYAASNQRLEKDRNDLKNQLQRIEDKLNRYVEREFK